MNDLDLSTFEKRMASVLSSSWIVTLTGGMSRCR
jgi:hypothetical protein